MKRDKIIEKHSYSRPDIKRALSGRERILFKLNNNKDYPTSKLYDEWVKLKDKWNYYVTLCSVKNSQDFSSETLINELEYLSYGNIEINKFDLRITESFLKRGRIGHLSKHIGKTALNRLKSKVSSFEKDALEIAEFRSIQDWIDFKSSLKFKINDKSMNIHNLFDLLYSSKRHERKLAYNLITKSFASEKIDNIVNRLIHIRDEISKSSSFDNYEEFVESESFRDWDYKEAFYFKELVKEFIVPILCKIQERKSKKLNIIKLENYDDNIFFKGGNPNVKGSQNQIVKECINSLPSFMTEEIFDIANSMYDNKLIDAVKRKNKDHGAFCWSLDGTRDSFILINLMNNEDLPETFFHEFGHALQFYFSGDYKIHELRKTSRELLEIPSISLELFSQEVFHVFYGDRAEERKILHIINLLTLICKICILDDWQRIIYRNPNMSQEERNQFWEDAEREFTPWRTPNPERWKQDYTIFESPFYDLDYGIATICSFQLWMEYNSDKKSAIKKYLKLCSLGGKKDFQETLKHAKLENPFNRKTFKKITQRLNEFLEQY